MGRFSVHPYVCLSPSLGHPARPEVQSARPEAQPAGHELAAKASGLAGWPRGGMNKQADGIEFFPILQDFVPYQGRRPASPHENQENVI